MKCPGAPENSKKTSFKWPLEQMKKEVFKKGDVLFKAGDLADKMFFIRSGAIRLIEIDKVIPSGQVIGEMGLFSPLKERTISAVAEEDLEVYAIGKDEVAGLFYRDSALAIELIQLSFSRFIENMQAEIAGKERLASELRIAREIQASMLPQVFPAIPGFEISATMEPAKEVGGDFYDVLALDESRIGLLMGDVSGRGVPASLVMAQAISAFRIISRQASGCADCLNLLNRQLCGRFPVMFVTALYMIIDIKGGKIKCASAGHSPVLAYRRSGNKIAHVDLEVEVPLGVNEAAVYKEASFEIGKRDRVVFFTDGLAEARNSRQEEFGLENIKRIALANSSCGAKAISQAIQEELRKFSHNCRQHDDITLIVFGSD
mgnify:CR=1 FL=1